MLEEPVRFREEEFHSLTTASLLKALDPLVSPVLRTSFTRLPPVVQTSERSTTSCGHSSSTLHQEDGKSRDTLSPKDSVLTVTEKNSSTPSSRRWSEQLMRTTSVVAYLQTTNEEMLT